MNKIHMKLQKNPIYKFIKRYPRISILTTIILFIIIALLPISLEEKILLPIRTLVIGFIFALGWWYFKATRHKSD
jgi:hypothetical protein